MDGQLLLRGARKLLGEVSGSTFLDNFTTYDYLYRAAVAFNRRVHFLTNTAPIVVVQGTTGYSLPVDYSGISVLDSQNRPFIGFTPTGGSINWIYPIDYSVATQLNQTTQAALPMGYYIKDAPAIANITGTATATGSIVNGETTLTDSTAPFSNVSIGDVVHDTTDTSVGIVVAITSTSAIVCALTDGTNNFFTSGDAYVVVPQTRYQVNITPPPSGSGTITVYYVQRPTPVYSNVRAYRLPDDYQDALLNYAAFLYKYSDREPNYGDAMYKIYDMKCREAVNETRRQLPQRNNMRVNFMKSNSRSNPLGQGRHRG